MIGTLDQTDIRSYQKNSPMQTDLNIVERNIILFHQMFNSNCLERKITKLCKQIYCGNNKCPYYEDQNLNFEFLGVGR